MLDIRIKGLKASIAYIGDVNKRGYDFRPYFRDTLIPLLERTITSIFDQEGPGWAPLAASTLVYKRRRGYSSKILVATGRYKREATNVRDARLTRASLTHKVSVPYAVYHEYGTSRMPARPVFRGIIKRIEPELKRTIGKYITEVRRG